MTAPEQLKSHPVGSVKLQMQITEIMCRCSGAVCKYTITKGSHTNTPNTHQCSPRGFIRMSCPPSRCQGDWSLP